VLDLLLRRHRESRTTLVMVTHDPLISGRAERRIMLRDGMVIEDTLTTEPVAVAEAHL
jgi:putative ABC transport system ATP-binding protein